MATVSLSPIFNGYQSFTAAGVPQAGGLLNTYLAGTVTPTTVYQDSAGATPHSNPIVLDAAGRPPAEIWLVVGVSTKFVLTDSVGANSQTFDNISGVAATSGLSSTTDPLLGAGLVGYGSGLGYAATTVGGALQAFGLTTLSSNGAGLVGFGPANGYATGTVGARVNKAGHPTQTNAIVGFNAFSDSALTGTIGYRTTAFGVQALRDNGSSVSAGGSNSAFGYAALQGNIDGSGNNAFGALALNSLTGVLASHNNAFGYRALNASTGGVQNNGFGFQVLNSLTTGDDNCAFGESVLTTTTNSSFCTGMGFNTLFSKTSGNYSVAYGSQAAFSETTAVGNTAIGKEALYNFTTQGGNTALGYEAGRAVAGGVNNTFLGYQSGTALNAGTYNTGVGYWSLLRLTTGSTNTAVGEQAGAFITTGSNNVCLGDTAGAGIATSSSNVAVGAGSLVNMDSGTNTAVGFGAATPGSAQTWVNTTTLGNAAQPTGSNQVTLGNTSIATIRAQVTTITAISDERDKKDIRPLDIPDGFIYEVFAAMYRWNMRDGTDRGQDFHAGVIAQQLDSLQDKYDVQWLKLVDKSNPDRWEATPGNLLMPLILSHQKLAARVTALEAR